MSREAHENQSKTRSSHYLKKSQNDLRQAIQQLDERLKHLKDNIIPPQPYLLSVPTDYPYRFHKSFINCWYAGTPFEPYEEELQYMSFHPHQNIDEELLKVEGGWSDADGNLVQDEFHSQVQDHSTTEAPVLPAARKKISLKDYKTKDKSSHSMPTVGLGSRSSEKVMNGDSNISRSRAEKARANGGGERKHAEDDARPTKSTERTNVRPIIREPDSPSPPKRRRLSSEDPKSGDELGKERRSLPALLSPTLPASKAGRSTKGLPSLLSPELPKTLQIALAEVQSKRSDHVRSVLGGASGLQGDKKPAEKSTLESGRNRSDSQLSLKSLPSVVKTSPLLNATSKAVAKPATTLVNGARSSPGPRQRPIIVLKYGKKNSRRVEMLLRFPPKPKKVTQRRDASPSRRPQDGVPESSKSITTPVKLEKKRQPDPSPERAAKKLKTTNDTPDRPRTPTVPMKTSGATNNVKRADPQITPQKELKPSAIPMQRMTSSDGVDAKTPPIDRGRTSTPVGSVPNRGSPAASSTPMSRDVDRSAWQEVNSKYHKLGKQLKTEAQRLAPSTNETDQILSAVHHIEALLCFMINLSAQHHLRPSDSTWETIMPYFIAVFKASRRHGHLHGLVIQLGAICRQVWHGHNMDKLYRDPLPDESLNSAPTPGSDGNTRTDDTEKYRKRYLEFKNQLVQNSRELQKAWLDGSRCLSTHLLEHEYPKTWSQRRQDTSHRSSDRINPAKFSKDFYLPLDPNTTVFEAAQFALLFMAEWTEKQDVAWKAKIDL